jgi:curved DNA-binding protein CbpA
LRINEAYGTLSNDTRRAEYDRSITPRTSASSPTVSSFNPPDSTHRSSTGGIYWSSPRHRPPPTPGNMEYSPFGRYRRRRHDPRAAYVSDYGSQFEPPPGMSTSGSFLNSTASSTSRPKFAAEFTPYSPFASTSSQGSPFDPPSHGFAGSSPRSGGLRGTGSEGIRFVVVSVILVTVFALVGITTSAVDKPEPVRMTDHTKDVPPHRVRRKSDS